MYEEVTTSFVVKFNTLSVFYKSFVKYHQLFSVVNMYASVILILLDFIRFCITALVAPITSRFPLSHTKRFFYWLGGLHSL